MAEARFDLVILHHTSDKSVEDLVQELLQLLGKAGDPYLEYKLSEALLFEQSTSAILDDIELAEGERYQEQFRQLNVETELRPTLQLVAKEEPVDEAEVEQYVCPACNHKQAKAKGEDVMNTCNHCGVVGEKLARNTRKKEIFSTEKRKLEQSQSKEMKEAAVRAHIEDEAAMRREALERLGVKKKKNATNTLIVTSIIATTSVASFFIVSTLLDTPEEAPINQTIATSDSPEAKKQPLINIQAGNGSIVINSTKEPDMKNAGNSGSKGATGEVISDNDSGMAAGQQAAQSDIATQAANQDISNASSDIAAQTDPQLTASTGPANPGNPANSVNAASSLQQTPAAGSATGAIPTTAIGTDTTNSQQLAALSQKTINTNNMHNNVRQNQQGIVKVASVSPRISSIVTTPIELNKLNAILSNTHDQEYFFDKMNATQWEEQQVRLQRLLTLNKPELALIFAESMEDPYPAALMVLEIAKYATSSKTGNTANNNSELLADLLLSMKALASQSDSTAEKAVLTASLSQTYDFASDRDSARSLLEQSVTLLESQDISLAERCQLLAQLEFNHRQFGNNEGGDFIAESIVNFAAALAEKEYVYAARAYTHLAAASLTENKQDDARAWLNQIPVTDAKQYLLAQMETISANADRTANQ